MTKLKKSLRSTNKNSCKFLSYEKRWSKIIEEFKKKKKN